MARRVGLPEHIRAQLTFRASAGSGHDADYPTAVPGRTVPASDALLVSPSEQMLDYARSIVRHLQQIGAQNVSIGFDLRGKGNPGAMTILWSGVTSPADLAATFAVSTAEDGTPRLPAWLSLRADHEFDLRWQPAY